MDLIPHSIILSSPTESQVKDSAPGCFGKEGQATILLDRALQIVRIEGKGVLGSEIAALDNELQDFLHSQLVSFQGSTPRECGSIAVTLRYVETAIFLSCFYFYILSLLRIQKGPFCPTHVRSRLVVEE